MSDDHVLPTTSQERKDIPLQRGCLDYFPAALAAVAQLSKAGNDKHNPGEEMHHARGKSGDHADCIQRHQLERGTVDTDGFLHDVKVAWRALAQLQEEMERRGAPIARGARLPTEEVVETQLCPNYAGDRIAGDDAGPGRNIKNEYYHGEHDTQARADEARAEAHEAAGVPERHTIYGYCAWCDMELRVTRPYVRDWEDKLFCDGTCAHKQYLQDTTP